DDPQGRGLHRRHRRRRPVGPPARRPRPPRPAARDLHRRRGRHDGGARRPDRARDRRPPGRERRAVTAGTTTPGAAHAAAMGAPGDLEACPLMPNYAPPAVAFAAGSGSWLVDRDGRRYLDLLSGLAVTSLGHAHPEVTAAIAEQAATLVHVSNLFGSEPGWEV